MSRPTRIRLLRSAIEGYENRVRDYEDQIREWRKKITELEQIEKEEERVWGMPFWNRRYCPHFRHVDQGHAICRRNVPYPQRAPDCSRETCEGGKDDTTY